MQSFQLMLGDCLDRMSSICDASIDLVLTDPPYGITACKWDSVIPLQPMWNHLRRVLTRTGTIALFACQPFSSALVMSNPGMFKYEWIWEKNKSTGFLNAKKRPLRNHEQVLVFGGPNSAYFPQKTTGHKPVNSYTKRMSDGETVGKTVLGFSGGGSTERYPVSVQRFNVVNQDGSSPEGKLHPTQKPVAIMEYLIKTYTTEGQVVLDFAMGSGSAGQACRSTNRKFIGIELDEAYFQVASRRLGGSNESRSK